MNLKGLLTVGIHYTLPWNAQYSWIKSIYFCILGKCWSKPGVVGRTIYSIYKTRIVSHSVSWAPLCSLEKKTPYSGVPRSWVRWHWRGQLQCLPVNKADRHKWARFPTIFNPDAEFLSNHGTGTRYIDRYHQREGTNNPPQATYCLSQLLEGEQRWN